MNKHSAPRNGFIHLYNPKKEGLGSYDIHYMNAYKKNREITAKPQNISNERYAA